MIGFGITSKNISSFKKADGVVVGSALCKEISESIKKRQNPVTNVSNMVKNLRKNYYELDNALEKNWNKGKTNLSKNNQLGLKKLIGKIVLSVKKFLI